MTITGLGFRGTVTVAALHDVLKRQAQKPTHLAVLDTKVDTPGFCAFIADCALPVLIVAESEIHGIITPTQSPRIQSRFGTGSVAEALALAGAGRYGSARLIAPRQTTPDGLATVAQAEVHTP